MFQASNSTELSAGQMKTFPKFGSVELTLWILQAKCYLCHDFAYPDTRNWQMAGCKTPGSVQPLFHNHPGGK
jgi:hypothetical protein